MNPADCCILNGGRGAWAFEPLANQLAAALGVDVSPSPRGFNYVLNIEPFEPERIPASFIPLPALELASDKRLIARCFAKHNVPSPRTELIDDFESVRHFADTHPDREWCLKFPTGCGANGHRMLTPGEDEPRRWPRPFIVQEFVRMDFPEVYRLYAAAGELFGWIVRRYPKGKAGSPWVAHARGAQYERLDTPPTEALAAAERALRATNLFQSFGCVDLIRHPAGDWLVLEVGTDGLFNHIDREVGDSRLLAEMNERIARSFWQEAARAWKG
jgi:glutathione synthase/RimK-type ligase-like ATP-grasp enzyme